MIGKKIENNRINVSPSRLRKTINFLFTLKSLGVTEHWNNSMEKKYSRNLGKSEGIELIYTNSKE